MDWHFGSLFSGCVQHGNYGLLLEKMRKRNELIAMSARPFITPTYQANLNSALRDVVVRLNQGLIWEAWESLKTLYYMSPPKVEEECREEYEKIEAELHKIIGKKSMDIGITQARQRKQIFRYLYRQNWKFLTRIKQSLFDKGYLEKRSRKVDTNVPESFFAR